MNNKTKLDKLINNIDKQIEFNQGKNIFLDDPGLFKFVDDTLNAIININP